MTFLFIGLGGYAVNQADAFGHGNLRYPVFRSHISELSFHMGKECKVKYVSKDEIAQGIRKQFSPEYAEFLLVQMGYSPKVCPKCGNGSTTLWLAKPNDAINGKMWAKWYFWCDRCLSGIRCPLGTWRIARETRYILHGDEKALAAALPENLKLVPQK